MNEVSDKTWIVENVEISRRGLRTTFLRSDGHRVIGYFLLFATVAEGEDHRLVGAPVTKVPE